MFCKNCGNEIFNADQYCRKCGTQFADGIVAIDDESTEHHDWEYRDFVHSFISHEKLSVGGEFLDESSIRKSVWESNQREILPRLQKRLDDGWTAITEVGPPAVNLRQVRQSRYILPIGFLAICLAFVTFGLFGAVVAIFLLFFGFYAFPGKDLVPVEARIKLRRACPLVPNDKLKVSSVKLQVARSKLSQILPGALCVILDDVEVARLRTGESVSLAVSDDAHVLQVRHSTWQKIQSERLEVEAMSGETLEMVCGDRLSLSGYKLDFLRTK